MGKLILDDALRAKLGEFNDQVELCDPSGQTLGYFLPADLHRELLYAWAKAQFNDEEGDRAVQNYLECGGGKTTAEVLAYLASLDGPEKNGS